MFQGALVAWHLSLRHTYGDGNKVGRHRMVRALKLKACDFGVYPSICFFHPPYFVVLCSLASVEQGSEVLSCWNANLCLQASYAPSM